MTQDLSAFKPPKSKGTLKAVEKSKGGRPPIDKEARKTEKATVYLTPDEKLKLNASAKKLGVAEGILLRMALADKGYI